VLTVILTLVRIGSVTSVKGEAMRTRGSRVSIHICQALKPEPSLLNATMAIHLELEVHSM
jgi:hypothetical protein